MNRLLIAYLASLVVFLGVDMVWLLLIARDFYRSQMGSLMAEKPQMAPAVIFYLIIVGGIVFFAIIPALRDNSWRIALLNGAVLGLVAYATYDLTNLAVVRDWPSTLSYVDLAWGTVLSAVAALGGYLAASAFG